MSDPLDSHVGLPYRLVVELVLELEAQCSAAETLARVLAVLHGMEEPVGRTSRRMQIAQELRAVLNHAGPDVRAQFEHITEPSPPPEHPLPLIRVPPPPAPRKITPPPFRRKP